MRFKAMLLIILFYPISVTPIIRADVSKGRFFSVAIRHEVTSNNRCGIVKEGWAGGGVEVETTQAALFACGQGCISVVTFKAVD